jgi:hypothetical protein
MENDLDLDEILATYAVKVDAGPAAIEAMVRAARARAVRIRQEMEERRLLPLIAAAFGLRRAAPVMWSAAAGMMLALFLGVSLGASHTVPGADDQQISIDFDSVLGIGTVAANADETL